MSSRPFAEGARVAMIGDSITHGGVHPSYIQQYYLTHFRDHRVKVYNLGIGGDTAAGALERMEEILSVNPTEAVVMFGTNDIGHEGFGENPPEAEIAAREERAARHLAATRELVERLCSHGIAVTLASSVGRDEFTPEEKSGTPIPHGSTALLSRLFSENAAALSDKIVGTVDYLTPLQSLQRELVVLGGPSLFNTPDRVHPSPLGQQLMARILLSEQGLPAALPTAAQLVAGWRDAPMIPEIRTRRQAEDRLRTMHWVYPHHKETDGMTVPERIAYWEKALAEERGLAVYPWAATMYRYYIENAYREDEIEAEYFALTDALYPEA